MSVDDDFGPMIKFNLIGRAWRLYQRHSLVWSLAMLIVMLVHGLVSGLLHGILRGGEHIGPGGFGMVQASSHALQILVSTVVWSVLLGGMIRMASNQIRGGVPRLGDLFSVQDQWFDLILVSILIGAATTLGHMLCVIPGLLVSGLLMLAIPLVVEGRLPATGAMIQSWEALKSQWLTATVFQVVLFLVAISGALLCCVGVFVTGPIYSLAIALLYHDFYRAPSFDTWEKEPAPFPEI